jgi:hydrogenase expression/formation protein HypE
MTEADQRLCPTPFARFQHITMAHGGGGRLSAELLRDVFLPAYGNASLQQRNDAACIAFPANARAALTTDSYVVQPLRFPGGNIGRLAVCGTINDLVVTGAVPLGLTVGWILEEGFPMAELRYLAEEMGRAAAEADVAIVAGDTKVIERGRGDGCYINTSGLGWLAPERDLGPHRIRAGDAILISGTIGEHGMAILSLRHGLPFSSSLVSDCAALHGLTAYWLSNVPQVRAMRDATRGGLSAVLHEMATASGCGIVIDEPAVPVSDSVRAACELLGLDPGLVANEGKLVAFVPAEHADRALNLLKQHPLGHQAARIGTVVADHSGRVVAKTSLGTQRWVHWPQGDQLPRIC